MVLSKNMNKASVSANARDPGGTGRFMVSSINCNSIHGHWPDLLYVVAEEDPDVVVLSETQMKPEKVRRGYKVPGYRWVFPCVHERGFAVLIRNSIGYKSVTKLRCEALLLKLFTADQVLLLACGYNRPNTTKVIDTLADAVCSQNPDGLPVVFAGDFNARHPLWCRTRNMAGGVFHG